jgi:hypothetical protein
MILAHKLQQEQAMDIFDVITTTQSVGPISIDITALAPKVGQTLFFFSACDYVLSGPTGITGWTVLDLDVVDGGIPGFFVYTKVSDGTETTVTVSGSTSSNTRGIATAVVACRNQDLAYVAHLVAEATTGNPNPPSTAGALAGEYLLCMGALEDDDFLLTIPGDSIQTLFQLKYGGPSDFVSIAGHVLRPTTNAYDPSAYTSSGNDGNKAITIRVN